VVLTSVLFLSSVRRLVSTVTLVLVVLADLLSVGEGRLESGELRLLLELLLAGERLDLEPELPQLPRERVDGRLPRDSDEGRPPTP